MNNQQEMSVGEQFVRLQNIAYIKQFLRKGSIKLLMAASLLCTFITGFFEFSFIGIIKDILDAVNLSVGGTISNIDEAINIITTFGTIFIGVSVVIGLIFPVTLLFIIIGAHNENPNSTPSGAIQFLHILSIIQFVFAVITNSIGLISTIISFISSIANNGFNVSLIATLISTIVSSFVTCLFYYYQTKFLGSIHKGATGKVLVSEGANGYGVFSVLFSIANILAFVFVLILLFLLISVSSSSTELTPDFVISLQQNGVLGSAIFTLVLYAVIVLLTAVQSISQAAIAFSFKNSIVEAVQASFSLPNGPYNRSNATGNSPFRTYGGNNSYSNYNYSSSGTSSQKKASNSISDQNAAEQQVTNDISGQNIMQPQADNNIYEQDVTDNTANMYTQESDEAAQTDSNEAIYK